MIAAMETTTLRARVSASGFLLETNLVVREDFLGGGGEGGKNLPAPSIQGRNHRFHVRYE